MRVNVHSRALAIDEAVRSHVERRMEFALGRFSSRITRVTVQLTDLNGPRGGEDKACSIEVRLSPSGSVRVEDSDADIVAVVDRVAERTRRAVARAIQREREIERRSRSAGGSGRSELSRDAAVEDHP